jgi:cytochrome c
VFHARSTKYLPVALMAMLAACSDMGTDPAVTPVPTNNATGGISFQARVLPIFTRHGCTGCHGGSGGLKVGTVADLLKGGTHGASVVSTQADNSILIKKLLSAPPFGDRMPQGGPYLPDSTVQVLKDWINQGAQNN